MVKKKRPRLTPHHRKEWLNFPIRHQHWTLKDWKKVIWSDENKINHLGSYYRRCGFKMAPDTLNNRLTEGHLKLGGGYLMIWGYCMLFKEIGDACKIDGRMDGNLYIKIWEDDLQHSLAFYERTPQCIISQQNNDPKHTCKNWFQDHDDMEVLL